MKRIAKFLMALAIITTMIVPFTIEAADDNILLHVDFDEGNAKDKSNYGINGTIVGAVEFVEGIGGGKAARIVNADKGSGDNTAAIQYIDFGTPENLKFSSNDFSISFWMKSDDYPGDGQALISNKNYSSGGNVGFTYGMFNNSNRLNFTSKDGGRKDIYNIPAADTLKAGWKKVDLLVNRADKAEVYIDGVLYSSLDAKGGVIDAGLPFVVGASGVYKNGAVDATIDDLIVRKGLMDTAEISSNYLNDNIRYHGYQFDKLAQEYSGVASVEALVVSLKSDVVELNALASIVNNANAREIIANKVAELKAIEQEIFEIMPTRPDKNQVLYMDFEDDVKDKSGNDNHGTIVNKSLNGLVEFTSGAVGKGLHIKSSNGVGSKDATEYIDIKDSENLKFGAGNFSIAMWVKFDSSFNGGSSGNSSAVVGNKNWTSGSNPGFVIGAFGNGMLANLGTKESGRFETARNRDIYNNQWNFVVVNVDRTNTKKMSMYVNNILANEKDISGAKGSIDEDALHWVIGADAIHKEGMSEMYMDELRIFNTVLGEQKMSSLYSELSLITSFKEKITEAKKAIEKAKVEATHTEKRIAEFEKGIVYLETEVDKGESANITRLSRDLNNMYDRFAQVSEPLMSFNTVTDTHIDRGQNEPTNLDNYYQDVRWLNPDSTAIMNSGDFTDSGKENEYKTHYDLLEKYKTQGRADITALGNHDVRWLCSPNNPESGTDPTVATCPVGNPNANLFADRYLKYNAPYMESEDWDGESLYYNKWVNGYNFVVINTEKDLKDWAYLSEKQLTWLDKTLAKDADPNKPIFISLHQTLKDTAYYEAGDVVGEQDEALKEVLRKYPQAVIFTGHIHSTVDRAALYHGDWGHQYDMASFSYSYTSGNDRRNQIAYQVDVFEDKIELKVRDHASGKWLDEYKQVFSVTDPLPADPSDATNDLEKEYFVASAGSSQVNEGVENLFDDKPNTIWHTEWAERDRDKFFLDFDLDRSIAVDGIRYMARSNAGNGTMLTADVLVSTDNGVTYTNHATVKFKQKTGWQSVRFPEVKATNIKLKVTESVGTYASGAEIRLTTPDVSSEIANVKEKITDIEKMDLSNYTKESKERLLEGVKEANELLSDRFVSKEELNNILGVLDEHIDALVERISGMEATYDIIYGNELILNPIPRGGTYDYDESRFALESIDGSKVKLSFQNSGTYTLTYKTLENVEQLVTIHVAVNTADLKALILKAEAVALDQYTPNSQAEVKRVLAEAKALLKDTAADQNAIENKIKEMNDVINGLEIDENLLFEKTLEQLDATIQKYGKIEKSLYTVESYKPFAKALDEATVMSVSAKNQRSFANLVTIDDMERAIKNLDDAYAGLKLTMKKPSESISGGNVSTGDTHSQSGYMILLVGSAMIFIANSKRERR